MAVLYPFACHACRRTFDALLDPKGHVSSAPCPSCGFPAPQDYRAKRVQAGAVHGELVGAYGHGTPERPFREITSGPQKGLTVVPNKDALFDDAKRKNDKEGTALEWRS